MTDTDHAEGLARAWVRHLRSGGSTPWADWVGPAADGPSLGDGPFGDAAESLPGAAQLEVVRRLAASRPGDQPVDFARLADVVLGGSGPGRGLGDLPLPGHAGDAGHAGPPGHASVFGPRPVDPAAVPEEELIRVCVGALADLLPEPGARSGQLQARRARRRRPWRRAFQLVGAPAGVDALRTSLAARGLVEGGRRPRVLVVGTDVDTMMRQVWTARVRAGGGTRWQRLWSRAAGADTLPVRVDLARVADHWARRVGPARVHLVVGRDDDGLHRAAAEALGLRDLAVGTDHTVVLPGSAASVDLLRRLNAVLNIRFDGSRSQLLRERVLPDLLDDPGGRGLGAPDRMRDWSRRQAARIAGDLAAGGYAVHGSLEDLVPGRDVTLPGAPVHSDVLALALRACLRAAEAGERPGKVR